MTEPDFDYLETVRAVYRQVVAEADPTDGLSLSEAREETIKRLMPMVDSGELKLPPDDLLKAAIAHVDKADGDRGDAALKRIVAGQQAFDMGDSDPAMQMVARLGGRRKPWGRISQRDLILLDDQRYKNARSAADAYDAWRPDYQRGFAALVDHSNLEDAYNGGAFDGVTP